MPDTGSDYFVNANPGARFKFAWLPHLQFYKSVTVTVSRFQHECR